MSGSYVLFGIPFQVIDEKELCQVSCDQLENLSLYTIFFVAGEQCGFLMETEDSFRNNERTTWVPVWHSISTLFAKKDRYTISSFLLWDYVERMCEYLLDNGSELFLFMETKAQTELVLNELRIMYPYLVVHTLSYDDMPSEEAMVNEINSVAPEILILGLHTENMKHFLDSNRMKTNARLCICVGELLVEEVSKKKKLFHNNSMSRSLKKKLRKYNKREQSGHEGEK